MKQKMKDNFWFYIDDTGCSRENDEIADALVNSPENLTHLEQMKQLMREDGFRFEGDPEEDAEAEDDRENGQ